MISGSDSHVMTASGPMTWTNFAIDTFIAPYLSQLTQVEISDRSELAGKARSWLSSFALRSMFVAVPTGALAKYGFLLVRRSASAVCFYELARATTNECISNRSDQAPALSLYAGAIDYWEAFLAQADQALRLLSCVADRRDELFEGGDGSVFERLHLLHADCKHADARVQPEDSQAEASFTVWMTDEGLRSKKHQMTWVEVTELVDGIESIMSELERPPQASRQI